MKFENTYAQLPERFFAPATPAVFQRVELIKFNQHLAQELGADFTGFSSEELARIFSGQKQLKGSHYLALAYSGHQFGHFVPTLGDGRAILLGELRAKDGVLYDLQLKGSGPTPFSRRGDGMSALGPVIREYLVSEAMFHLNVPTTRSLAAVLTGEKVMREKPLPGGVLTRVAKSHLRIGTFEYFASRNDLEGLKILLDYSVNRLYPDLERDNLALSFFKNVVNSQVGLISKWMSLGFIHGVMNTDNMSISGETMDYGPCAFMDYFNPDQVYCFIDEQGRYRYLNQSKILAWNLSKLASCLIPLVDESEEKAVELLNDELAKIESKFTESFHFLILQKLGATGASSELVTQWLSYLENEKLDFTLGFRNLSKLIDGKSNTPDLFYRETPVFYAFLENWRKSLSCPEIMDQVNPLYIPRNHQVERAIKAAVTGDYSVFEEMNRLLENPFQEQIGFERYVLPPLEDEVIKNTFCGT